MMKSGMGTTAAMIQYTPFQQRGTVTHETGRDLTDDDS
jgi:hypothetical protein